MGCSNRASRRSLLFGTAGLLAGCTTPDSLPDVALPPLAGLRTAAGWPLPGIETAAFRGRVTLLNVWASWCPYCRGEHELLKSLAGQNVLAGLVHNDTAEKVRDYLAKAGNPYAALSIDAQSALYAPLRQRGVPHTYVIGRNLEIVAKVPGALTAESIAGVIRPAIARARSA